MNASSFFFKSGYRAFWALCLFVMAASQTVAQQITVSSSSGSAVPGGTVTLAISLAGSGGAAPTAVQWTMSYPPSAVVNVSVGPGPSAMASGKSVSCSSMTSATTCVAYGMNQNIIGAGVLATATFDISLTSLSPSVPIQVGATVASSPTGGAIFASGQGSAISVASLGIAAAMTANAGTTPQSAAVNTAFSVAPAVTMIDSGSNPVEGVNVVFTAPSTGASGLFGSSTSVMVTTNSWGVASAPFTANATVGGPYTVSAASTGLTTIKFALTNTAVSAGLQFYPLAPCRIADTRANQPFTGAFGPPSLTGYVSRDFPVPSSPTCQLPSMAQAYSLNFTAVPSGELDFLSAWPTGQPYPGVSTLNSPNGAIIANAAIVPAGTGGSITVLAGNPTDLIIDINGYFAPPGSSGLDFYPLTPCRVADTRSTQPFTGAFGPPSLSGYVARDFPLANSPCLFGSEQAYSLNFTVVPPGEMDFLSAWPEGQSYRGVSTLNAPDGNVMANAAMVPAGTNGDIAVLASDTTNLIIDINGKFAAPGAGAEGLQFYALTPCRVADTRSTQTFTGAFGPPSLAASVERSFPIQSSPCGIPTSAQAYALNMTVVPQGPLGYLSAWPQGQSYPGVSTLNSPSGNVIANAAIVPAGTNGGISVVSGNPTDLIIDVVGYFAP